MRNQKSADVVIVGGGISGCAAAYYLTTLGVCPIVVEREGIASAASGFAQGGLYLMSGAGLDGPLFSFANESLRLHHELYPALKEETGLDSLLASKPVLAVALSESDVAEMHVRQVWQTEKGFITQWLDDNAVRKLEPGIGPEVLGALVTDDTWVLDSGVLTKAFMRAAEKRGAQIHIGNVQGLEWNGDRVTGVRLADEVIHCPNTVLALGPWSAHLQDWIDVDVPVRPIKGEILRMRSNSPPATPHIAWHDSYMVKKPDGLLWTGTTEDDVGFDDEPTESGAQRIIEEAGRIYPAILEATIEIHTACLRPVTPDNIPIVGEVPGKHGVYIATGGGRKGILVGPAIGKSIADIVVNGATDLSTVSLGLERFMMG
ncbi:MAG: FAD-dependent oxidoreductase [Chloroflexota bacterium]|nr:FAD-dependent oxidoreductase [Chloroflexota bacterium]